MIEVKSELLRLKTTLEAELARFEEKLENFYPEHSDRYNLGYVESLKFTIELINSDIEAIESKLTEEDQ